ncbi:MAG: S-methyl-5'-thioinosine phosphorylase [Actinomycetia bacterium]|nr:S-methyl-5'-thioinosine phosphorylase [Actinomycetes bacterium]
MLAFITGSGFYELPDLTDQESRTVTTAWGDVTVALGRYGGRKVAFIPRHGSDHSIPPHRIEYRANIRALADIGATGILAVNVVGGIDEALPPGALACVDQFIEFTKGRAETFFDEAVDGSVRHTDMTEPYDAGLRAALVEAATELGIELASTATYVCTNGPRFETSAEIDFYRRIGGHVVGMTGYPEVALAREAGIPYAALAVVSNPAAGMTGDPLTLEGIWAVLDGVRPDLLRLLAHTAGLIPPARC